MGKARRFPPAGRGLIPPWTASTEQRSVKKILEFGLADQLDGLDHCLQPRLAPPGGLAIETPQKKIGVPEIDRFERGAKRRTAVLVFNGNILAHGLIRSPPAYNRPGRLPRHSPPGAGGLWHSETDEQIRRQAGRAFCQRDSSPVEGISASPGLPWSS